MLILNQSFPAAWDGRPPGMSHADWPIWLVFRWSRLMTDQCYFYNVRIGEPVPAPVDAPESYRRQWELSSLYRIDALGVSPNRVNVYEVKQLGTPQDLWQLCTYRTLLQKEILDSSSFSAWLIAETVTSGLLLQALELKVKVWYPTPKT